MTSAQDLKMDAPTVLVSPVIDTDEVALRALAQRPAAQSDPAVERVLGLESGGLLTVASFQSAI